MHIERLWLVWRFFEFRMTLLIRLAVGCDEVVHKPFKDHEIFKCMARQLGANYIYEKMSEGLTKKE